MFIILCMHRANTKESLEKHFEKSRQLAEKPDKGLYVLYIQCFEVCACCACVMLVYCNCLL